MIIIQHGRFATAYLQGIYKIEVTTLTTNEKDSDNLKLSPPSRIKELPL